MGTAEETRVSGLARLARRSDLIADFPRDGCDARTICSCSAQRTRSQGDLGGVDRLGERWHRSPTALRVHVEGFRRGLDRPLSSALVAASLIEWSRSAFGTRPVGWDLDTRGEPLSTRPPGMWDVWPCTGTGRRRRIGVMGQWMGNKRPEPRRSPLISVVAAWTLAWKGAARSGTRRR
jgi:hypothetical protein